MPAGGVSADVPLSLAAPLSDAALARTKIWRKRGMVISDAEPRIDSSMSTSRQPMVSRPSESRMRSAWAAQVSAAARSWGKKAMPVAYWPAGGRSKAVTSR